MTGFEIAAIILAVGVVIFLFYKGLEKL